MIELEKKSFIFNKYFLSVIFILFITFILMNKKVYAADDLFGITLYTSYDQEDPTSIVYFDLNTYKLSEYTFNLWGDNSITAVAVFKDTNNVVGVTSSQANVGATTYEIGYEDGRSIGNRVYAIKQGAYTPPVKYAYSTKDIIIKEAGGSYNIGNIFLAGSLDTSQWRNGAILDTKTMIVSGGIDNTLYNIDFNSPNPLIFSKFETMQYLDGVQNKISYAFQYTSDLDNGKRMAWYLDPDGHIKLLSKDPRDIVVKKYINEEFIYSETHSISISEEYDLNHRYEMFDKKVVRYNVSETEYYEPYRMSSGYYIILGRKVCQDYLMGNGALDKEKIWYQPVGSVAYSSKMEYPKNLKITKYDNYDTDGEDWRITWDSVPDDYVVLMQIDSHFPNDWFEPLFWQGNDGFSHDKLNLVDSTDFKYIPNAIDGKLEFSKLDLYMDVSINIKDPQFVDEWKMGVGYNKTYENYVASNEFYYIKAWFVKYNDDGSGVMGPTVWYHLATGKYFVQDPYADSPIEDYDGDGPIIDPGDGSSSPPGDGSIGSLGSWEDIVKAIPNLIPALLQLMADLITMVGSIPIMLGKLFSYIPSEILKFMQLGVMGSLIIGVIRWIRG